MKEVTSFSEVEAAAQSEGFPCKVVVPCKEDGGSYIHIHDANSIPHLERAIRFVLERHGKLKVVKF